MANITFVEPAKWRAKNLFGSKCIVLKNIIATLFGLFGVPPEIWHPGHCAPLDPPNAPGRESQSFEPLWKQELCMALKVILNKSDNISNWRKSLHNVCKAIGFSEEHKSIVSSANRETEDLVLVWMSLPYTEKVSDQVWILEARHSLYVNDQNKIS